jgi:hypothetical protein
MNLTLVCKDSYESITNNDKFWLNYSKNRWGRKDFHEKKESISLLKEYTIERYNNENSVKSKIYKFLSKYEYQEEVRKKSIMKRFTH